jgi:O-antigen ligase
MHESVLTVQDEARAFQDILRRHALPTAAIMIGAALGVSWALGAKTAALAPAAAVVLLFLLASWTRWFLVALCALWISPVILGVRFLADLSPSDPIIFVLFLLFVARAIAEGSKIEFRGPLLIPFALFFGAQALSAAIVVFRSPTLSSYKDLFPFVKLIEVYLLCIMVSTEVKRGNLKRMLIGAGIVAAIAVGVGFLEHVGDYIVPALKPFSNMVRKYWFNTFWRSSGWPAPTLSMAGGTFDAYPMKLGAFASLFSVVTFAFAFHGRKRLLYRGLFITLSVVGLVTVIGSASRGALLNSIVGIGAVILLTQRMKITRKVLVSVAIGVLVLIVIVHFSPYGERFYALVGFFQKGASVDDSFYRRVTVRWRLALEGFSRSPIVGREVPVSLQSGSDNMYLRILEKSGILGLMSLCYLFWRVSCCGMSAWKHGKDELARIASLALACATLGMIVQCFTADILRFDRLRETYWIVFGFIAGLYELSRVTGESSDENSRRHTHVS